MRPEPFSRDSYTRRPIPPTACRSTGLLSESPDSADPSLCRRPSANSRPVRSTSSHLSRFISMRRITRTLPAVVQLGSWPSPNTASSCAWPAGLFVPSSCPKRLRKPRPSCTVCAAWVKPVWVNSSSAMPRIFYAKHTLNYQITLAVPGAKLFTSKWRQDLDSCRILSQKFEYPRPQPDGHRQLRGGRKRLLVLASELHQHGDCCTEDCNANDDPNDRADLGSELLNWFVVLFGWFRRCRCISG